MTKDQVKVGMQVVVNKLPGTIIYTVKELHGFMAVLTYQSGDEVLKGSDGIDISCLMKPSKEQLANQN